MISLTITLLIIYLNYLYKVRSLVTVRSRLPAQEVKKKKKRKENSMEMFSEPEWWKTKRTRTKETSSMIVWYSSLHFITGSYILFQSCRKDLHTFLNDFPNNFITFSRRIKARSSGKRSGDREIVAFERIRDDSSTTSSFSRSAPRFRSRRNTMRTPPPVGQSKAVAMPLWAFFFVCIPRVPVRDIIDTTRVYNECHYSRTMGQAACSKARLENTWRSPGHAGRCCSRIPLLNRLVKF